jgi:hypothetical protein
MIWPSVTPWIAGRVDREDDVGELDREEAEEERRRHALPVLDDEEAPLVRLRAHRDEAAHEPQRPLLLRGVLGRLAARELHPREDEEEAEQVGEPVEAAEQRRPRHDEEAAQDERAEDPEQDAPVSGSTLKKRNSTRKTKRL